MEKPIVLHVLELFETAPEGLDACDIARKTGLTPEQAGRVLMKLAEKDKVFSKEPCVDGLYAKFFLLRPSGSV